jgi:hypothetical protein
MTQQFFRCTANTFADQKYQGHFPLYSGTLAKVRIKVCLEWDVGEKANKKVPKSTDVNLSILTRFGFVDIYRVISLQKHRQKEIASYHV